MITKKLRRDERIEYCHLLVTEVSKKFLLEGENYIVTSGHEHVREIMTLYAKQTNLLESILLLSKNNMHEETAILFRSQLNNHMIIAYLMNDTEDRMHYKDYMIQPLKTELFFLNNIQHAVKNGWMDTPEDLKIKITEYQEILKSNGYYNEKTRLSSK